jgi:hypothetical protein
MRLNPSPITGYNRGLLKSIKKVLDYHLAICYGVADVYIFNARGC